MSLSESACKESSSLAKFAGDSRTCATFAGRAYFIHEAVLRSKVLGAEWPGFGTCLKGWREPGPTANILRSKVLQG